MNSPQNTGLPKMKANVLTQARKKNFYKRPGYKYGHLLSWISCFPLQWVRKMAEEMHLRPLKLLRVGPSFWVKNMSIWHRKIRDSKIISQIQISEQDGLSNVASWGETSHRTSHDFLSAFCMSHMCRKSFQKNLIAKNVDKLLLVQSFPTYHASVFVIAWKIAIHVHECVKMRVANFKFASLFVSSAALRSVSTKRKSAKMPVQSERLRRT